MARRFCNCSGVSPPRDNSRRRSSSSEEAVRTALRTQQIIAHESGVASSVDPLGGSYLIEYLTDEIERMVMEYLEKIDQIGGALRAIEIGYVQAEIQNASYRYQKEVENQERIIVGVNKFEMEKKIRPERLKINTAIEAAQKERLQTLRSEREAGEVQEQLQLLRQSAESDQNLMPVLIRCVEHNLTLGEICGVLREVWGEYQPPVWG